uniref:Putative endonuclease n=1 Tax=Ixodes ricinus TaxID=34613 RepID=A0A0K8RM30_IXORI
MFSGEACSMEEGFVDIVDALDEMDLISPIEKKSTPVKASAATEDPKPATSTARSAKQASNQNGSQVAGTGNHPGFTLKPELIVKMQMEFPENLWKKNFPGTNSRRRVPFAALLHRTYKQKERPRNKTFCDPLDYIGDYVLKFIISQYLLEHCVSKNKENLAHRRSIVECQEVYAFLAVRNGFHDHVFMDDRREWEHLTDYVKAISGVETLEQLSKVEKRKCFVHNFFQSVAGAIYVDSGYDLKAVEGVYLPMLKAFLDEVIDMDIEN